MNDLEKFLTGNDYIHSIKYFTVNNFNCAVVMQKLGHRCGYILIHKNYPSDIIDSISCHGGITLNEETDDGRIIGFDCAHGNDGKDKDVISTYHPKLLEFIGFFMGECKSEEYVLMNLRGITEQLRYLKMESI